MNDILIIKLCIRFVINNINFYSINKFKEKRLMDPIILFNSLTLFNNRVQRETC